MSTPLAASYRIAAFYHVAGLQHVVHNYCKATLSAGVWSVQDQATMVYSILFADAAQGLANTIAQGLATGTTLDQVQLQQRVGVSWNPVAFTTATFAPVGTAPAEGWGWVAVVRNINFKKLHIVLQEPYFATLAHYPSSPTGVPAIDAVIEQYTSAFTDAHAPFRWAVGRDNAGLLPNGVAGVTVAPNRHTRRRRGLA